MSVSLITIIELMRSKLTHFVHRYPINNKPALVQIMV